MAVSLLRQLLWVCRHSEHLLFSILTMLHNLTISIQSRLTTISPLNTWRPSDTQISDLGLPGILAMVKPNSNGTGTLNFSTTSPLIRILEKCHFKSRQFSPITGHPTTPYECSRLSRANSCRRCLTPDYPNRAGTYLFSLSHLFEIPSPAGMSLVSLESHQTGKMLFSFRAADIERWIWRQFFLE